jgi:hypothetical protein
VTAVGYLLVVSNSLNFISSYIIAIMAASPDTNWLAKIEGKSFVNVSIDSANGDAINTEEFLQAARSLVTLFGMFN